MMLGSCCCGAVQFEVHGEAAMMGTCHCTRCRKVGASSIVFIKRDDLQWVAGKEHVQLHQPNAPYQCGRCFCRICGTSLGEILSSEESFPIAANAIDKGLTLKPQFHEFVREKPDWYDICDDAKQYEGHPVG